MSLADLRERLGARVTPVLVVGLALALRLAWLETKPAHFDEGVNGSFVDEVFRSGAFHYDPANYHGPLHFYVLFLSEALFGKSLFTLRLPLVLVGTASVWLVGTFETYVGRRAAWLAALALAVSPAAVFYARTAIHESWFLFFLILVARSLAGLARTGSLADLRALCLGCAGLVLTKETYLIHAVALALAFPTLWILERLSPSSGDPAAPWQFSDAELTREVFVAVGLVFFFYSGGLLAPECLPGIVTTFAAWFATGTREQGHAKPFFYWLGLLGTIERTALFGLAAVPLVLLPRTDRVVRLLAIAGTGTFVAYSIVPYKTPWCVVSLIWPFALLFGWAATGMGGRIPPRLATLTTLGAALLLAVSTQRAVVLSFAKCTDATEPYVYVQTHQDVRLLTERLERLVGAEPERRRLSGNVLIDSYHPLPWLLSDYDGVRVYEADVPPEPIDADFLFVARSRADGIEARLSATYWKEALRLRDSLEPAYLYLRCDTFRPYVLADRPPDVLGALDGGVR